jgi:DNA mismatch endonuclease, patch repair protein
MPKIAPAASSPAVRRVMQGNRGRDTKPEQSLRSAVFALGMRYRVDCAPVRGLRRRADLVFTRARVAVFVDGCFWHGCPEHFHVPSTNSEYWTAKIERNRLRDRDTDERLSGIGWTVVRIWEHDSPAEAALRVQRAVLDAS